MSDMEFYRWYKAHGICPRCRTNNAMAGHVLCAECAEKKAEYMAEYRKSHRAELNAKQRARRARYRAEGLCQCGKPARPGMSRCIDCSLTAIRNGEKYRALHPRKPLWMRKERGICLRCDEPAVEGKRLCAHHLELARQSVKVAKAAWYERRAQCSKVKL